MAVTPERRILVVANRTAATPALLEAVKRYAREQPTTFVLLIPDAPRSKQSDWTLEEALPALQRAAAGPVEGRTGTGGDPFQAVQDVLATSRYDGIIISTLPKRTSNWLRRGLPTRIASLGLPTEVITPADERESAGSTLSRLGGGGWPS